jgi:hypothetical protein
MALRAQLVPLAVAFLVFGCGGSSSETPPPLEPLPVNLHYDRASTALSGEVPLIDAGAAVVRAEDVPQDPGASGPPVRSTWGGDRTAPQAPLK